MREVCTHYIDNHPIRIGGPGINVCMDETHLYVSKYGRGNRVKDVWVVGAIVSNPQPNEELQFFAKRVENTNLQTILPLVQRHIVPGSILMTDGAAVK